MDFTRMCLVLTVCVTLMAHAVFSAPAFDDVDTTDFHPDFDTDMAFPTDTDLGTGDDDSDGDDSDGDDSDGDDSDGDDSDGDDFFSRIRRQVGQLASGGRYGSRSSRRTIYPGRLAGRRIYQARRKGRVVII